jgi:hypothetical protein
MLRFGGSVHDNRDPLWRISLLSVGSDFRPGSRMMSKMGVSTMNLRGILLVRIWGLTFLNLLPLPYPSICLIDAGSSTLNKFGAIRTTGPAKFVDEST